MHLPSTELISPILTSPQVQWNLVPRIFFFDGLFIRHGRLPVNGNVFPSSWGLSAGQYKKTDVGNVGGRAWQFSGLAVIVLDCPKGAQDNTGLVSCRLDMPLDEFCMHKLGC